MQKLDLAAFSAGIKRMASDRKLHEALLGVAVLVVVSVLYF